MKKLLAVILFGISIVASGQVMLPGVVASSVKTTTGLMGWYKMDELTGSVSYDETANNNDGAISAGVTLPSVQGINHGYTFNGTSSSVLYGSVCQPTTAISIVFRFKTADITADEYLISAISYGTGWSGYSVRITASGQINFIIGNNTATVIDKYYGSALDNGSWHYVACTFDGTSAYVRVDGNKSTVTTQVMTLVYITESVLRVGANSENTLGFFGGEIDQLRIFNRALSDVELTEYYNES